MSNLFILVLKYLVPIEQIEAHLKEHQEFVDSQYAKGNFIGSGPQVPRTGVIIIAKGDNKESITAIIKNDPFSIHQLARYQIYEFIPRRIELANLEPLISL